MRRVNARVRQRRRQDQLYLPPSGLQEDQHAEDSIWSRAPSVVDEVGEEALQHPERRPVPA